MRFNLQPLFLRRWLHRHHHQNPTNNLKVRALSQNQFADLRLASQSRASSSLEFRTDSTLRHRAGYPNLFDRLTPKR